MPVNTRKVVPMECMSFHTRVGQPMLSRIGMSISQTQPPPGGRVDLKLGPTSS